MTYSQEKIYTDDDIKRTYKEIRDLMVTKDIIKTYSTNKNDIRDIALDSLDLTLKRNVLDLGCGYGFIIEKLKGRLHKEASITGIDLVENNKIAYLNTVQSQNYKGEFINKSADVIKNMKTHSFDMIISCYSLYFFPHLVSEISRLLMEDGIFIVITHSKNSLAEIMDYIPKCLHSVCRVDIDNINLRDLFSSFSMEDGYTLLSTYFKRVNEIDYCNTMKFSMDNIDDCIFYFEKKKNLIYKDLNSIAPGKVDDLLVCLKKFIINDAQNKNGIELNKNDAIFHCYKK